MPWIPSLQQLSDLNKRVERREATRISHRDGLEDLLQKGRDLEKMVLSRAVRWHVDHRVLVYDRKTVIFD